MRLRFKVKTLDQNKLTGASADLAAITAAFQPDLLIGIRSGGYVVAERMAPHFPQVTLLPITCRRPSTKKKQKSSFIKTLLRKLPESVNSRLRILEHIVLTQLRKPKPTIFTPDAEELAAVKQYLERQESHPHILIVDDSVDSGATLAAVVNIVREMAGEATIRTAVISVTTISPFVEPNYMLYRYVLCRFPWSLDFKS